MKLSRDDVAFLMRSLLRSMEKTPGREMDAHSKLYGRLSEEFFRLTPQHKLKALVRALDGFNGEYSR